LQIQFGETEAEPNQSPAQDIRSMTLLTMRKLFLTLLILGQPWHGAQAAGKIQEHKIVSSHGDIQNFTKGQEPAAYGVDARLQPKLANLIGKPMTASPRELPLTAAPSGASKGNSNGIKLFATHHIHRIDSPNPSYIPGISDYSPERSLPHTRIRTPVRPLIDQHKPSNRSTLHDKDLSKQKRINEFLDGRTKKVDSYEAF
jgi:hypothetical protein